jgi:hypothetical protein
VIEILPYGEALLWSVQKHNAKFILQVIRDTGLILKRFKKNEILLICRSFLLELMSLDGL